MKNSAPTGRTIGVEGGAGNVAAYGNLTWGGVAQVTGGSTSMASSWERYRKAGAAMRIMLVEAAARDWDVPASEIKAEMGKLTPCLRQDWRPMARWPARPRA